MLNKSVLFAQLWELHEAVSTLIDCTHGETVSACLLRRVLLAGLHALKNGLARLESLSKRVVFAYTIALLEDISEDVAKQAESLDDFTAVLEGLLR